MQRQRDPQRGEDQSGYVRDRRLQRSDRRDPLGSENHPVLRRVAHDRRSRRQSTYDVLIGEARLRDAILVPLQCEFFALEGLSQLIKTVEQVKETLNPDLIIHGIVLTMYDARNNLANQVVADVREFMGRKVYDTIIPRNVRVSEAPSYGKPVLVYDLKCVGSEAYLRLATEIIQREKELRADTSEPPDLTPAQPPPQAS